MKSTSRRYKPMTFLALLLLGVMVSFQNCAKVQVADLPSSEIALKTGGAAVDLIPKNCLEASKNHGDVWLVPAGTSRETMACKVGVGNQFNVFNVSSEVTCDDGKVVATGKVSKTSSGVVEGVCDLDCGSHKNGELYFTLLGNSDEVVACPTSLTVNSKVTYKNEAEYKCTNTVSMATGNTRKSIINETPCPALSFNSQDNIATIAYEDTYIPAGGGVVAAADHDYNDFVANVKVLETYNSLEQLTQITVEYVPVLKLSGIDAQFLVVFDGQVRGRNGFVSNVKDYKSMPMFEGNAKIKMEQFDSTGKMLSSKSDIPKNEDLMIYSNTATANQQKIKAVITIIGFDPALNKLSVREGLSIKRYRSLMHVAGTRQYDVDLSDINPAMFDNKGLPLAFFVPVNWKSPKEGQSILAPYPSFQDHANYLLSGLPLDAEPVASKMWFNNLVRMDLVNP